MAATVACLVCVGTISCAANTVAERQRFLQEVLHYSREYVRQQDYGSLRWLADHALFRGMSRESVEFLLGPGREPPKGWTAWPTMAHPAGDYILLVHYNHYTDSLERWEWVSSR